MSDIAAQVGKFAGDAPNEVWLRTGQVTAIVGVFSMVGLNAGGIAFDHVSGYSPLLLIILGMVWMIYGTNKRKTLSQARQRHEIEVVRQTLGTVFAKSSSVGAFVEEVMTRPMTRKEIQEAPMFSRLGSLSESEKVGLMHLALADRALLTGDCLFDHEAEQYIPSHSGDETLLEAR